MGLKEEKIEILKRSPSVYPPKTWAEIKGMWETGGFLNAEELSKAARDRFKKCPSYVQICNRLYGEGWNKYRREELKEERQRRNCEEIFEDIGWPVARRIDELTTIISAPDDIQERVLALTEQLIDTATGPEIRERTLQMLKSMFDSRTRALGTKLQAIAESFKLTGAYAPEKKDLRFKNHGSEFVGKNPYDMTLEELEQENAAIEARLKREECGGEAAEQ